MPAELKGQSLRRVKKSIETKEPILLPTHTRKLHKLFIHLKSSFPVVSRQSDSKHDKSRHKYLRFQSHTVIIVTLETRELAMSLFPVTLSFPRVIPDLFFGGISRTKTKINK